MAPSARTQQIHAIASLVELTMREYLDHLHPSLGSAFFDLLLASVEFLSGYEQPSGVYAMGSTSAHMGFQAAYLHLVHD